MPTRRPGLAPLLFRAARLLNERAVARIEAEAHVGLRPAHTSLLPHLDLEEGSRLTDLARDMGISKQAAGELVEDLERMGVVRREADPADGRAKRVRLTRRGHAALRHGQGTLRAIEKELTAELGRGAEQQLCARLVELLAVLERDEPR